MLQSTELVIQRIHHLFREISEIEVLISQHSTTTAGPCWEALCYGMREWRYHELLLHRHELRLIYMSSLEAIVDCYSRKALGWQRCWCGGNGALEVIQVFVDGDGTIGNGSGSSGDESSVDEDDNEDW